MILSGSVQPGDRVVVGVEGDDLHFGVETSGAAELLEAEEEEERREEPAATPA